MTASYYSQSSADLSALNTMALACQADLVISLTEEAQLEHIFKTKRQDKGLFVLSGGSNVLLPPTLNATVIRPLLKGITVLEDHDDFIHIEVMAGENWHELVLYTVNNGWFGLENLALIPGLTGAAPVQNIGAYGVQLEDCLTHVRACHLPTQTWHDFDKAACQFGYRDSLFKQQAGEWLITRVGFALHKDPTRVQAGYGDVQIQALQLANNAARDRISPIDVMQAIIAIRQSKLPDPKVLPNCGSFFKNPVIDTAHFQRLQMQFPQIVGYKVDEQHTKVAAGWLIDQAGLKGGGIAPILSHDQQALVLTNHSHKLDHSQACQKHVAATQHFIQQQILALYNIMLEREPVWIDSDGQINLSNTTLAG